MVAFGSLWGGSKKAAPSTIYDDDQVYPLHLLDLTDGAKKFNIVWTYVFHDVLDADKLNTSLRRLLEIGDWRKLGGRIVQKDGKYQINAPKEFTAERPANTLSREDLSSMRIEDHPAASQFPRATGKARGYDWNEGFFTLSVRPDIPTSLEQYVNSDVPLLSLHVASFSNATVVGVSWPHVVMDGVGQIELMRAWSLVLAGRESEVPAVVGAQTDALMEIAGPDSGEREPSILDQRKMSTKGIAKMVGRFVWIETTKPRTEVRYICLPKEAVAKIHAQCLESLPSGAGHVQFSKGDSLMSWLTKQVIASEDKVEHVTIFNAMNARYRLSPLLKAGGVFLQNMVLGFFTFISPESSQGAIGEIALAHRKCLEEQTTEPQARSLLGNMLEERIAGREFKPFFGDSNALVIFFNNLSKMDMLNVFDFSPAVVKPGDGSHPTGKAVYYHMTATDRKAPPIRNYFIMYGQDHDENYWISSELVGYQWQVLNKALQEL